MQWNRDFQEPRKAPAAAAIPLAPGPAGTRATVQDSFARPEWFAMLARHCFANDEILLARAEANSAKVTLPLIDIGDHLYSLSNYYSFSFAPMCENVGNDAVRGALLTRIARDLRRDHRRISLYPLYDDDGSATQLRQAFARAGWMAFLTDQNSNFRLDLNGRDFATYWKGRPGKLRGSLTRKIKAAHFALSIHDRIDDTLWQDYCAVYAASWKNAEPFPAMIRAIADDAAARGVLRLGFARSKSDGVAVATQLWTIEGDTACIHKIAHDSSHDARSPGSVLSHHLLARVIDHDHVAHVDFGTGGNAYKRDWMEIERPMLRLDCFDPRSARMWFPALKTRISQLVRRPG
jgi:hypothetical protein